MQYDRPLPKVRTLTEPFWEGTRLHELRQQYCLKCGALNWYPRHSCFRCGSLELAWKRVSGLGRLYSFTVLNEVIRGYSKYFESELPLLLGLVDLDEGVRMFSNIVNCKPAKLRIGMRLEVVFEKVTETITLPKFGPAKQ
jgi:uncharacterized OB-fold protein